MARVQEVRFANTQIYGNSDDCICVIFSVHALDGRSMFLDVSLRNEAS